VILVKPVPDFPIILLLKHHGDRFWSTQEKNNKGLTHLTRFRCYYGQNEKKPMRTSNGVLKEHFELFFKECEWRFNNPKLQAQLRMIKQRVKQYLTYLAG
jgi:transposase-like protein